MQMRHVTCAEEGGPAHGIVKSEAKRGVSPSVIRQGNERLRTQSISEQINKQDVIVLRQIEAVKSEECSDP